MVKLQQLIAYIAVCISHTIFIFGFISQAWLNYKLKTAKGLSTIFILGNLNVYLAYSYCSFCMNFPLIYKLAVPFSALIILIIIFQDFYYAQNTKTNKELFMYLFNITFILISLVFALKIPFSMAKFYGWVAFIVGSLLGIPQIFKIYRTKSVHGFSFMFVLISFLGFSLELMANYILGLPNYAIINSVRGLFVCIIFFVQFILYSNS